MSETEYTKQTQTEVTLEEVKKITKANKELIDLLKLLESLGEVEQPKPTYTSHFVNMRAYSE